NNRRQIGVRELIGVRVWRPRSVCPARGLVETMQRGGGRLAVEGSHERVPGRFVQRLYRREEPREPPIVPLEEPAEKRQGLGRRRTGQGFPRAGSRLAAWHRDALGSDRQSGSRRG